MDTSLAKAGKQAFVASSGGEGFLARQMFDKVHATLRRNGA